MSLDRLKELPREDFIIILKFRIEDQFKEWCRTLISAQHFQRERMRRACGSIKRQAAYYFQYISECSSEVKSEITPLILSCFNKLAEDYINCVTTPLSYQRASPMYQTIVNILLQVMQMSSFRVYNEVTFPINLIKEFSIGQLQYLHNITELVLPGRSVDFEARDIEQKIASLTMLKKFEYKSDCTNAIVKRIGECCPNMRNLNIRLSRRVSDTCIESLLNLRKLREIDLQYTNVSNRGYIELLQRQNIRKIVWVRNIDNVLCRIYKEELVGVRSITCFTQSPIILALTCPQITELTLHAVRADITDIRTLFSLNVLNLQTCNYKTICLEDVLLCIGSKLEEMRFCDVDDLCIDDVIVYCNNLKTFEIHSCEIDESPYSCSAQSPHFFRLENLKITDTENLENYLIKLRFYSGLRVLHVRRVPEFRDIILEIAVDLGELKYLRELVIEQCPLRKANVVISVISRCICLRKFGNVQMMECFNGFGGDLFREYMQKTRSEIMLIDQPEHYVRSNMTRYLRRGNRQVLHRRVFY